MGKKYIELRIYLDIPEDELDDTAELVKDNIWNNLDYEDYPIKDITYEIKEKE